MEPEAANAVLDFIIQYSRQTDLSDLQVSILGKDLHFDTEMLIFQVPALKVAIRAALNGEHYRIWLIQPNLGVHARE